MNAQVEPDLRPQRFVIPFEDDPFVFVKALLKNNAMGRARHPFVAFSIEPTSVRAPQNISIDRKIAEAVQAQGFSAPFSSSVSL
jgi:hypothetical protein